MSESSAGERVTFETVRRLALALPGVEEGTSYGTPAFRVRKKLLARMWEDGEVLAIAVDLYERDALLAGNSDAFFLTDHYRPWPWMLVRLDRVRPEELRDLLEDAWRRAAPKRLLKEREAAVTPVERAFEAGGGPGQDS